MRFSKTISLCIGVVLLSTTPVFAQENAKVKQNEQTIFSLKEEVELLRKQIAESEKSLEQTEQPAPKQQSNSGMSKKDMDELKSFIKQTVEDNNRPSNTLQPNEVTIYINEVDRLKQEIAVMKVEMEFMRKELQAIRKDMDFSRQVQIANMNSGGRGGTPSKGGSDGLNDIVNSLRQDLVEIKEQTNKTNEMIEVLNTRLGVGSNEDVSKLKDETSALKTRVDKIEKTYNSDYMLLETTRESITNKSGLNKQDLPPGYYIIIASGKGYNEIVRKKQEFEKKGISTGIIQNKKQTWYHLFTESVETRTDAGVLVSKTRLNIVKDAWWLKN
jgi:hypothetical protein